MRRLAAFRVLGAPASGERDGPHLGLLTQKDLPEVAGLVLNGSSLQAMGGLYGLWARQALTLEKLQAETEAGHVLGLRCKGRLKGMAIVSSADLGDSVLAVTHAEASQPFARTLACELCFLASSLGRAAVEVAVPDGGSLHRACVGVGFEPDAESDAALWVYEYSLEGEGC